MKGILTALLSFYLLSVTACTSSYRQSNNDTLAIEKELISSVDNLFAEKKYSDGVRLLESYLKKYPASPYSDDAAYRLAYVCVIADEGNSYFNYKNAEIKFRQVLEKYPATNYFSACKNWIKILNLYNSETADAGDKTVGFQKQEEYREVSALLKENETLKRENERLKKTLSELEEALQR